MASTEFPPKGEFDMARFLTVLLIAAMFVCSGCDRPSSAAVESPSSDRIAALESSLAKSEARISALEASLLASGKEHLRLSTDLSAIQSRQGKCLSVDEIAGMDLRVKTIRAEGMIARQFAIGTGDKKYGLWEVVDGESMFIMRNNSKQMVMLRCEKERAYMSCDFGHNSVVIDADSDHASSTVSSASSLAAVTTRPTNDLGEAPGLYVTLPSGVFRSFPD